MPSTFGQWLILILALLVGLAGGWVLRDRQAAASPTAPIVEGDPVAGAADTGVPATATVDHERPAAVVDDVPPPAAVTEEPAQAEYDAPPAAATLAANATTLPVADTDTTHDDATEPVPVDTAPAAVDAAPVAVEPTGPAVTGDAEPAPVAEAEPAADDEPVARPATVVADAEQPTPEAEQVAAPAVVPAPRAAVEDEVTTIAVEPEPVAAPAVVATNGATPVAAVDDFRRIQGIGPKLAAALQTAGIHTYRQLGELDEAALRETIRAAGLRAASSLATWPQQARVLAGAPAEADRVLPAGASEDA
ncbi:hypothetical protein GCM10023176_07550 [Micromonospora coerulea]|uniref:Helix-hairpin-helix domain-containing protein n=1 Tax=Micromonospora coerulea TaxID=47856 RepID=A0ABP8S6Y5_9ACTN